MGTRVACELLGRVAAVGSHLVWEEEGAVVNTRGLEGRPSRCQEIQEDST